jgi:flagellin-like protein
MRKRKAVSPVIATVILVAVAISVAVGVSYWMGGISAQYTQFEKIEIQTAYSTYTTGTGWVVDIELKNSGSAASTITHLFVNDVAVTLADPLSIPATFAGTDTIVTDLTTDGLSIPAGDTASITMWIDLGYAYLSSGTTINIKLHSAGGMDYIKLVRLS